MANSPPSRVQRIALCALAILLLALLVWRLEWVEEEVDLGATKEARRNPFLASQRLLERYSVPYDAQDGFIGLERMQWRDKPIGQQDTLILISTYHNLHEHQLEPLWRWVEAGGRLIVSIENPFIGSGEHLTDRLLQRMDLNLHPSYTLYTDDSANAEDAADSDATAGVPSSSECRPPVPLEESPAETPPEQVQHCSWQQTTVYAQLGENEPELAIGVSGDHYLSVHSEENEVIAGDHQAAYLVRREVGAGEIYAITSATGWTNDNIGCDDNAYLFWRLTADSPAVLFAINQRTPSFWRYLWQLSAVGCVALLLALGLWLWAKATRFGPTLGKAASRRRPFTDHVRASGEFILRHGGPEPLIQMLREELISRLEQRHPGFTRLSRDKQTIVAQNLTGSDQRCVRIALYHSPAQTPFIDVVRCLQQLRNHL